MFDGYAPLMNKPVISLLVHATSPKTGVLDSFPWRQGKNFSNLSGSECCTTPAILVAIFFSKYISIEKTQHTTFLFNFSNCLLNIIPPLPPAFGETGFLLSQFSLFSFFMWLDNNDFNFPSYSY